MPSKAVIVPSEVILRDQSDWELWIYVVKQLAEAGDVWEYINPNQPHHPLQKPQKPTRPTAAPQLDADNPPPPTAAQQAQYTAELAEYNMEIKEYRRLKDKLGQVETHVTKSIDPKYLYHIKDKDSLYEKLRTLQELLSPTNVDQEYRVQKAYELAKAFHA
jgi:hypothetical protein